MSLFTGDSVERVLRDIDNLAHEREIISSKISKLYKVKSGKNESEANNQDPQFERIEIPLPLLHSLSVERANLHSSLRKVQERLIELQMEKDKKKKKKKPYPFLSNTVHRSTFSATLPPPTLASTSQTKLNINQGSTSPISLSPHEPSSLISPRENSSSPLNSPSFSNLSNTSNSNNLQSLSDANATNNSNLFNTVENTSFLGLFLPEELEKIIQGYSALPKKPSGNSKNQTNKFIADFLSRMSNEVNALPNLQVIPFRGGNAVSTMKGPMHSSAPVQGFGDHACCLAKSLYPSRKFFHMKDGDPITDRYSMLLFENRVLASLACGCNWGERARRSAKKACKAVNLHLAKKNKEIKTLKDAATAMLEGYAHAHKKILDSSEEGYWETGTTTLITAFLLEVEKGKDQKEWGLLIGNLGTNKVFIYSRETKKLKELINLAQPQLFTFTLNGLIGGRIGAYQSDGRPDLRNFDLSYYPCKEGDIIIILSDGISDNLTPKYQGISPKDFAISNQLIWDDVDPSVAMPIYVKFMEHKMESILNKINSKGDEEFSVQNVCKVLTDYCVRLTEKNRKFMLNNPGQRVPVDYLQYPGKLDHCTVIAFQVGDVTLSYNQWMGKANDASNNNNNN